METRSKEQEAPLVTEVKKKDSTLAKIGRFMVGSIIGVLFIIFCFLMLSAALKGPDTIRVESGATGARSQFGLLSSPSKERLRIGDAAPDFFLEQLGGEPVQLSALRGKTVFINFWASWCKPCEEEMPAIQKFYMKYKDAGVVVLAVNIKEDDSTVKTYFKTRSLTVPVLMDRTGNVPGLGYRVTAYPESYFVDKNGAISESSIGPLNYEQLEAKLQRVWKAAGN